MIDNKMMLDLKDELTLDHIFILVNKKAPEAIMLKELGLFFPNIINHHVGLGTSGTYFFFNNFYLELLWIEDHHLYQNAIQQLYCNEMKNSNFFPKFGIAFRKEKINSSLPFDTVNLRWDWMQHGTYLEMAKIENEYEPLYFIVPEYMAYKNKLNSDSLNPLKRHKLGVRNLTKMVYKTKNNSELSEAGNCLSKQNLLCFEEDDSDYLELHFDNVKKSGGDNYFLKELSLMIRCNLN